MMSKIPRNISTKKNREFWDSSERIAKKADNWPASKRAGINVSDVRPSVATCQEAETERGFLKWNGYRHASLQIDESSAMLRLYDRQSFADLRFDVTDDRCIDLLTRVDFWLQHGVDPISGDSTN